MHRSGGPPARTALAAVLPIAMLVALVVAAAAAVRHRAGAPEGVPYTPAPGAPRLTGEGRLLRGVADVADFDVWADTLAVLDARSGLVAVFGPGDSLPARTVGRPGPGPGELRLPSSLTRLADGRLVVADLPGLQLFGADGAPAGTLAPRLPCRVNTARVRSDSSGAYLSGNCAGLAGGGDTLFAVLLHSADLATWTEAARQGRLTLDGRWGSAYAATEPFGEGIDRHFFGPGVEDCLDVVTPREGAPPAVERRCGAAPLPFHVPERPGVVGPELRARGPAFRWPEPMVRWAAVVAVAGAPVVARPFRDDSLTFHAAAWPGDGPPADLLVAGFDVVTCRRGWCLWRTAEAGGVRVWLAELRLPTGPHGGAAR